METETNSSSSSSSGCSCGHHYMSTITTACTPASSSSSSPTSSSSTTTAKVYARQDLEVFNLLQHPVYVFDVLNRSMWWANAAAVRQLWNADSLEELLQRDFSTDMSQASHRRMLDYVRQFRRDPNAVIREQWTMYPAGEKVTVHATCTGITIAGDDSITGDGRVTTTEPPHVAILSECDLSSFRQQVDQASLRGVEMLRHLPVAVSQFTIEGELMCQNPEALEAFGGLDDDDDDDNEDAVYEEDDDDGEAKVDRDDNGGAEDQQVKDAAAADQSTTETTTDTTMTTDDAFSRRFVDRALGRRILRQLASGAADTAEYSAEAQQLYTRRGPRWSLVRARRSKDPVTAEPVILYAARDISEVVQAKNEADRANMEKSEMLAVLGHEIRTPLHHVVGFIELLGHTSLTPEQTDFVKSLQSSTLSLMSIINDVLDFTKLEAGKMEIEKIPFEPTAVCKGCLEIVRPIAEKKGLSIHFELVEDSMLLEPEDENCGSDGCTVLGDPNRIRQVILNLLSNAVKFTQEGGITLRLTMSHCEQQQHSSSSSSSPEASASSSADNQNGNGSSRNHAYLRVSVEDTGVGVSAEQSKYIFNKYRQSDATVARQYGGTGLGLAICKILAEAMHGTMTLSSKVNEGSEFTFEIPVEVSVPEVTDGTEDDDSESSMEQERSLHILVAEDNKMNQKLAAAMLRRAGHTVDIVENGMLAVEAVESGKACYDMILMDIQMPVLGGIEATQMLRKKGWSKSKLPVVGLTASFQTADLAYYQEIGMNDCIGKPVRLHALQEHIRRSNSLPDA